MTNTERNDLAIAHATPLKPMAEIADMMGLESEEIELYGAKKAKIRLGAIERLKDRPNARATASSKTSSPPIVIPNQDPHMLVGCPVERPPNVKAPKSTPTRL